MVSVPEIKTDQIGLDYLTFE